MAFLVLEYNLKTFSNLLGPNDHKKVKKIQKINTLLLLAFDLAFMTFTIFFGLLGDPLCLISHLSSFLVDLSTLGLFR